MSPRPRFLNLKPEKREDILEVAAEEFSQKGFEGASFNQIIERAGLSKGAAYYYFDDKADLFDTVLLFVVEHFSDFLDSTDTSETPEKFWETTNNYVIKGMNLMRRHTWLVRFMRMIYAWQESSPNSPVVKRVFEFGRLKTRTFIESGQKCGAVRTDLPTDLLTQCVFGLGLGLDRWLLENFDDLNDDDLEKWSARSTDLMRRLLEDREGK